LLGDNEPIFVHNLFVHDRISDRPIHPISEEPRTRTHPQGGSLGKGMWRVASHPESCGTERRTHSRSPPYIRARRVFVGEGFGCVDFQTLTKVVVLL